ncbi:MAG TPA: GNAT family N-acetyltransferase [Chloroflexia bacterium]|jgi:CelD/BcsL family acetyltransferase involved in cellulose biosynthesis
MEYRVTMVQDEGGLQGLEEAWSRLSGRSDASSIFTSFPWSLAWWHSFGGDKSLYVLVASDAEGQVRGIAPLMLARYGPSRKLAWIGTGLGDTGDLVVDDGHAGPVIEAMLAYLQQHRRDWDLLDLDEVPPYSHLASWLEDHEPAGLRTIQAPRNDCPFIPIPATWEEYTQTLQRKPRQHLESFARRVVEESGAYFRLVTEEADVPAAVARFYALHRARWATKEDELAPEHTEASFLPFLEETCTRAAAHGLLRLCELCVGDATISSWISFNVNGRWNGYMTGFDPEWSSKRPGKVLHGFVMRQALAEHARELDLGRGNEGYKYEMGAVDRKNWRFVLANDTARSALAFGQVRLRMQAREMVHRMQAAKPSSA